MKGTVLSISVLSVGLGLALAELGVVEIDVGDTGVLELIELALILTLIADGLHVERELLRQPLGPDRRGRSSSRCRSRSRCWHCSPTSSSPS